MSESERQELLTALQQKLVELGGAKDGLAQERSNDPLDEAQAELALNLAVRQISIDWTTRRAVLAALDRIRSGEYGTCEHCGEPIHAKRLEAVPWATLCVTCQAVAESENSEQPEEEPETIQ
jgi:DnaK suppressor protein